MICSFALNERGGLVKELHAMRTTGSQEGRAESKDAVRALKRITIKITQGTVSQKRRCRTYAVLSCDDWGYKCTAIENELDADVCGKSGRT